MSTVELRIELPTYSRSFKITVPDSFTILDVKQEIAQTCPGQPRVEGQKLIWRGRFLADDEKVEAIWKSPNGPRILHLSVHPSAWVSGPPAVPSTVSSNLPSHIYHTPTATPTYPLHQPTPTMYSAPPQTKTSHRISFIEIKHQEALSALVDGSLPPVGDNSSARELAVKILEANGCSWPSVLDEPYPTPTPGGLEYERIRISDLPYLSLRNPDASPTPFQAHALRVLAYTFSILSREFPHGPQDPPNYTIRQHVPNPQTMPNVPHLNDLLQQIGLPPLRNIPIPNGPQIQAQDRQPNQGIAVQEIPIRPLLAPLFMLMLRTILLLYFVAPTRKPIFGILIFVWVIYEIWQPIRNNLLRQLQDNGRRAQQNGGQGQPAPPVPGQAPVAQAQNTEPGRRGTQTSALVDMLGNMNLEYEQNIVTRATRDHPMEPSLSHKVVTFFGLLLTTLHPAVWNQRRTGLRRREGTIRTEFNVREAQPRTDVEGEEGRQNEERAEQARTDLRRQHEQRPRWIKQYMQRVISAEWVDEAD